MEAKPLYERSQVVPEKVLSPGHPRVATTLNGGVVEFFSLRSVVKTGLDCRPVALSPSDPGQARGG